MRAVTKQLQILLLAFIALLVLNASAEAKRLPVTIFTSADGLGSGFVDYIYRDSRGFMWFCTRDGLSRYDGSRFVTYRIGDTSSPPGIEVIFETRAGEYYVSTTGGTFRLRPDVISDNRSSFGRSMSAEFLFASRGSFLEDKNGTLWMNNGPLSRVVQRDGKTELEAYPLSLPDNPNRPLQISELAESQDGSIWMNSTWGLIRRLPDSRIVFYPVESPAESGANSMVVAGNGLVWLTMGSKVFALKPEDLGAIKETGQFILRNFETSRKLVLSAGSALPMPQNGAEIFEYSPDQETAFVENSYSKRLLETADGTLWITAENLLYEITNGVLQVHRSTEGLPAVMARMAEDGAGNLWIGGHAGLARVNRSGLVTFGAGDGPTSSRFFASATDLNGSPVFAGRGHTLNRFNGTSLDTVRPDLPQDALYLWTSRFAMRSSDGDWWLLSNKKLYRFSGVSDFRQLDGRPPSATYDTSSGLISDGMFQIFEDSKRNIWVSTRGSNSAMNGVSILAPGTNTFRTITEAQGYPKGRSPSSFLEDSQGRVWLGFYEGGLGIYDNGTIRIFENSVPSTGLITDMLIDSKDRMWLATSVHGLYRVDDYRSDSPTFTKVDVASAPLSNNIRTLAEDRFGRLYLGGARGVERYSPDTGHVKRFTVSEGLAADFVVDSFRDKNDDLWFVTNDGVSRLTPLQDEDPPAPQVLIGGLRISGRLAPVSELGATSFDTGDLVYTDNNFQIDWIGLDLRAGEFLRYQYMLEGADKDWSALSDQVTVTYANLGPGSYRFLVRAINTEGVSSAQPAVISFQILRPIWLRWWFLTLLAIAIGLTIYGIFRYRTNKLKQINTALDEARKSEERLRRSREERLVELERVRSRIATDLHDDIGASLTQIAILSQVAQTKNGENGNGSSSPLTKITEVSNELVGTMSDIVWSINPSKDHLSDLVQRMRRFASDVLAPNGILARFDLPDDSSAIIVDSNIRREVFLVFKEAINNIAKHSKATRVSVRLSIDKRTIELDVQDNGTGFENVAPSFEDTFHSEGYSGNGIPSMRRRALEMGGNLAIESTKGSGTTVKLRMPRELAFDDSIIPNRGDI
jgi:signal transduction histidine kinase/ligand-binding sensor domain-containing protein